MDGGKPILFFDGVCNLCSGAVQFVIRHDRKGRVRFASLQSEAGQAAQKAYLDQNQKLPDSLLLLKNGRYYSESAAALRLAHELDGGWKLLQGLFIFPKFIRNWVYRWVARNRYKWFGKKESCWLPTPELKSRFLE